MKARLLYVLVLSTVPRRVAITLSDETKKPPNTFVTTKVSLRHPNR